MCLSCWISPVGSCHCLGLAGMIAVLSKIRSLQAGHVLKEWIIWKALSIYLSIYPLRLDTLFTCCLYNHNFNPLFVSLKMVVPMVTSHFADRLQNQTPAYACSLSEEPPCNGDMSSVEPGKAGTEQLAVHASAKRFGKCWAVKHPSGATFKKKIGWKRKKI